MSLRWQWDAESGVSFTEHCDRRLAVVPPWARSRTDRVAITQCNNDPCLQNSGRHFIMTRNHPCTVAVIILGNKCGRNTLACGCVLVSAQLRSGHRHNLHTSWMCVWAKHSHRRIQSMHNPINSKGGAPHRYKVSPVWIH